MNSANSMFFVTVLGIFSSGLFSIAKGREIGDGLPVPQLPEGLNGGLNQGRLFFPIPELPGAGNGGGLADLINCRPLSRTFVQHGLLCLRPNMITLNCRNQTCVCTSLSAGMPGLPGGVGQLPSSPLPVPTFPSLFPGLPGGGFPSLSVWNCAAAPSASPPTENTPSSPGRSSSVSASSSVSPSSSTGGNPP